jgi:hypothetical protein
MNAPESTNDRTRKSDTRELSSVYAFYWNRYCLPAGLCGAVVIDTAAKILDAGWTIFPNSAVVAIMILCAGIAVAWNRNLKRVYWRGDHLLVSNGRRSVKVSLSDIAEISASPAGETAPRVHLLLHRPTRFGTKITFVPRLTEWAFRRTWASGYPVVEDLRAAVAESQGLAPLVPATPPRPLHVFLFLTAILAAAIAWAIFR